MSSLPQTHNALTKSERSRLVRSNRKLQALLGATPAVIEAAVSQSRTPGHVHVGSSSIPPSPSSFTGRRHVAPTTLTLTALNPIRPCLLFHLDSPTGHKHTLSLPSPTTPSTPLSPTTNMPPTPPATLSYFSTKDTRRRHAVKLARTLGENIAPELVAAPAVRPSLHRAASSAGCVPSAPEHPALRSVFSSGSPQAVEDISAGCSPSLSPSPSPSSSPSPTRTPTRTFPSPPRTGATAALQRSFSTATRAPRSPMRRIHRRGGSLAFAEEEAREVEGAQILTAVRLDLQTGKRRKEKEWSGEWNLEMDAVAKWLRSLK
ncbi:hypothetical protein B0H19DRAFT_1277453 [Mycena capillaripes]|nr:hypothetical protein B0H19DRAFT_1277453 [Mycena capillaripes]